MVCRQDLQAEIDAICCKIRAGFSWCSMKKAKVGPKFLKYMKAQSVEEAGSLKAAVATIAARDYRKAISTLEEQIAKAEAGRADLPS